MTNQQIYSYVDHTLLKPDATIEQIKKLCDEAKLYNTASVCVNPCYVDFAKNELMDCGVRICTVIGFPLGANTTKAKCVEAQKALQDGANEFDMVINIGALKSKNYQYVLNDIKCVKQTIGAKTLKVIVETCLLTQQEKETICDIVYEAKADYIKTSTGFSSGGATFEDIAFFKKHIGEKDLKIKAAGGIRTKQDMEKFIELGADRLGTSSAVSILEGNQTTTNY